jgi:pimeloyl-ACP methyl ester carboxylesterase
VPSKRGNARNGLWLGVYPSARVTLVAVRTGEFLHEGHRLVFDEYGQGARPLILLPGLLLPRSMHRPLALELAERGNRVLVLDPLGHGESDRPFDMTQYSFPLFAHQVVGLMDHLGLDEAVIGGTSLGANITLETLVAAPDRIRGAIIEMPVLDNALTGCAIAFTPLLLATTFGRPLTGAMAAVLRRLPRTPNHLLNVGLDMASLDPKPSGAYLQGLFFGRIAPPKSERMEIQTPSLVIGHSRDPVHPFSDADALLHEMPNARMVRASWIGELRVSPERLTNEISSFVDGVWKKKKTPAKKRPGSGAKRRRAGAAGSRSAG